MKGKNNDYKSMLILNTLGTLGGEASTNDIIDSIYNTDRSEGLFREGWRFYVHLNKLPAILSKKGFIKDTGKLKQGKYCKEKIWRLI